MASRSSTPTDPRLTLTELAQGRVGFGGMEGRDRLTLEAGTGGQKCGHGRGGGAGEARAGGGAGVGRAGGAGWHSRGAPG